MSGELFGFMPEDPMGDLSAAALSREFEERWAREAMFQVRQSTNLAVSDIWPKNFGEPIGRAVDRWRIADVEAAPAIPPIPKVTRFSLKRERLNQAMRAVGGAYAYRLLSPDQLSNDVHHQKIRAEQSVARSRLKEPEKSLFFRLLHDAVPQHPTIQDTHPEIVKTALSELRPGESPRPRPWGQFDPLIIAAEISGATNVHATTELATALVWRVRILARTAIGNCPRGMNDSAQKLWDEVGRNLLYEGAGLGDIDRINEIIFRHEPLPKNITDRFET